MKKLIILLLLMPFNFGFAQCTITGADQIEVGERQTYRSEGNAEICIDCFEWTYLDEKILLEADSKSKEITIKGALPGTAVLSLAMGKSKCTKTISIISPTTNLLPGDISKCNIAVENFTEIRTSGTTVVLEAITAETNLTYKWIVSYRAGDQKMSTDKKAQFEFSNNRVIDKVELEVAQNKCTKKLTKMYDTNFWYFF